MPKFVLASLMCLCLAGCQYRAEPGCYVMPGSKPGEIDCAVSHTWLMQRFPELKHIELSGMIEVIGYYDDKTNTCYVVTLDRTVYTEDEMFALQHEHVHRLMYESWAAARAGDQVRAKALMDQAGDMWRDLYRRAPKHCTHPALNKRFGLPVR